MYIRKNMKFTDEQYFKLYRDGYNDAQAADMLRVARHCVTERRWKLGLLPINIVPSSNPPENYARRKETNNLIKCQAYARKKLLKTS